MAGSLLSMFWCSTKDAWSLFPPPQERCPVSGSSGGQGRYLEGSDDNGAEDTTVQLCAPLRPRVTFASAPHMQTRGCLAGAGSTPPH
jgi:hypothetical protein